MANQDGVLRRLLPPALAVVVLIALWQLIAASAPVWSPMTARVVENVSLILLWLGAGWLLVRLLEAVLWRSIFPRHVGHDAPRLLTDLVAAVVWIGISVTIATQVLDLPVAGILTTSGVAIAVLGFALRDMLASVFAGIALNVEQPYDIGDWIEIQPGEVGRVVEISWLTTRAVTREGITVVVPNGQLASRSFRNYSRPAASWRDSVLVPIDFSIAPPRVERILLSAALSVSEVAAMPRQPDVKIREFSSRGVVWQLRFWVTNTERQQEIRYKVQRAVLRHLHQAGISLPYEILDVFHAAMPDRVLRRGHNLDVLLARSELFGMLNIEECGELARQVREHRLRPGDAAVRQGDPGSSLFVVLEGMADVHVRDDNGKRQFIRSITPGDMFGEFSLLTGEPRSATVTARIPTVLCEIGKESLEPILQRHPELVDNLSRILAQRQTDKGDGGDDEQAKEKTQGDVRQRLVERIRSVFGL